jgi:hypothetical protein
MAGSDPPSFSGVTYLVAVTCLNTDQGYRLSHGCRPVREERASRPGTVVPLREFFEQVLEL